jgi:hypothetical protein
LGWRWRKDIQIHRAKNPFVIPNGAKRCEESAFRLLREVRWFLLLRWCQPASF